MRVRKFHVYLTLVMFSTGFLMANSIELTQLHKKVVQTEKEFQQETKLNERIIAEREKNRALEQQYADTQRKISQVETAMANHQSEAAALLTALDRARLLAGTVPATGAGVMVTLRDNPSPISTNVVQNIVHEQDIWRVVNELFVAGAEGISVNDQRLVTSSSIRCVGPTVIVNGVKSAAPFVIKAVGDPGTLEGALHLPGGVIDSFEGFIKIETAKKDSIELPAFVGDVKMGTSSSS
ncbi:hypothetical protein AYJ08_12500 [Brevibacillus sp. SKDU10]|uniref:DUF881 domain-containing protein n=1 Tax=Brevibacillus sp. SKDU10 TaxID=1247872 RepID=UPI0007C8D247|nr:DUF881 domain-containing protein [Brevibacillus sp. SKDU10]OAJ73788.1 hypothetical protein AYJ08_12500 [Brevibacillus sp. SKDU10]